MNTIAAGEVNICQTKKKVPPRKPPRLSIKGKPGSPTKGEPRNCKEGVASGFQEAIENKEGRPRLSSVARTRNPRDYQEIDCEENGVKKVSEHVYESISDHSITTTRSTSSQTEGSSDLINKDLKVFRESGCQTEDELPEDSFRRTKKRNSDDEAMSALGKTKESRLSSASSTSTHDSVDSGHFSARHPERSPTSPDCENNATGYLWQPEGLSPEEVKSFMESLPRDKIPRTECPEGMAYFETQLAYQNPEQDADPDLCKSLKTKDQSLALKNVWLDCVKSRGTGYIQFAENSKKSCKSCGESIMEKDVMVVSRDGVRHPSCFSCTVCHELLAKLIYYNNGNNHLYCGRHFAELIKPRCLECDELVICGTVTKAMGHSWHADHFCCVKCGKKITGNKYTTTDKQNPMCLSCHTTHLADVCKRCKKKITVGQRKIIHENEYWHDECFTCEKCEKLLSTSRFNIKDDKVLCEKCCQNGKSKLCYRCGDEIKPGSQLFEHNQNYYHAACFSCEFCNERITSGFMEHENWFYCPECYHRLFSEKCAQCGLPVTDDGITYDDKIWHNSCFDCFYCNQPIASQRFLIRFGNRYCNGCYEKMFAKECHSCHELIKDAEYLTTNNMYWHNQCFQCSSCQKGLKNIGFHMINEKIYCSQCPDDVY